MKVPFLILFVSVLAVRLSAADLAERLERVLAGKVFQRALTGVRVVALADGRTVFSRQADTLFQPASNAKLFTAALVLDRLDPAQRIQTSAYGTAQPDAQGRLAGDLILYGRGDPSFAPRFHRGDSRAPFRAFAAAIHRAGLRHVTGDLIADESHFNNLPWGRGWTWDELNEHYAAAVSALSALDNVAYLNVLPGAVGERVRLETRPRNVPCDLVNLAVTAAAGTGSRIQLHHSFPDRRLTVSGRLAVDARGEVVELTVPRPAKWFGELLRAELAELGVRIDGTVRVLNWTDRLREPRDNAHLSHLASVSSPPVGRLNEVMMSESQNLYAQLLLLQVGSQHPRTGLTTEQAGLAELEEFLRSSGIDPNDVRLEDGAGLSRRSLVTPAAVVRLLVSMAKHTRGKTFRAALPLAGIDGTLSGRFHQTPAFRNLRAKTGSLNHVSALSGYVSDATGRHYAFAVLMNNHSVGSASARAAIDSLATEIAR